MIVAALLLIALLIFIAQNPKQVRDPLPRLQRAHLAGGRTFARRRWRPTARCHPRHGPDHPATPRAEEQRPGGTAKH